MTLNHSSSLTLFENTARQIGAAAKHIQERHIANYTKADPAYGAGVAQAIARLGSEISDGSRRIA